MGLLDRLKDAVRESFAPLEEPKANSLDIESLNGQLQEAKALGFCITHLCLDGDLDIEQIKAAFCPSLIHTARMIYMNDFDAEGLSIEDMQNALRHEWLLHYGEAIFIQKSQQYGLGTDTALTDYSFDVIDAIDEELNDKNKVMFDMFCSFMGYRNGEMHPQRMIDCVDYAIENGLSDTRELTHWFPIANAMIDDIDPPAQQKSVAPNAP